MDVLQKNNFRPLNILVALSKIFEKTLGNQLLVFFRNILSKFQRGFRKGLWYVNLLIAYCLSFGKMLATKIKHWSFANRATLSCQLKWSVLIAKLHAYDLVITSLNLLQDYLSNRKQTTKVDSFFSSWEDILVPRS